MSVFFGRHYEAFLLFHIQSRDCHGFEFEFIHSLFVCLFVFWLFSSCIMFSLSSSLCLLSCSFWLILSWSSVCFLVLPVLLVGWSVQFLYSPLSFWIFFYLLPQFLFACINLFLLYLTFCFIYLQSFVFWCLLVKPWHRFSLLPFSVCLLWNFPSCPVTCPLVEFLCFRSSDPVTCLPSCSLCTIPDILCYCSWALSSTCLLY